jgi:RNA recognition motif-containing protein
MGTRLYVGNLSFSSTSETVREAFARIGEVTDVHIVTDRTSGQSRGFGFVTMGSPAEATKAIESMNGADLDGRPLRVNEAEERPQRSGGGGGGGGFGGGGGHGGGGGGGGGRRGGSGGGGGGGGGGDRRNRW